MNLNVLIIHNGKDSDGSITGLITYKKLPIFISIFEHNLPINYCGIAYRIESYSYSPSERFNLFNIKITLKKIRD